MVRPSLSLRRGDFVRRRVDRMLEDRIGFVERLSYEDGNVQAHVRYVRNESAVILDGYEIVRRGNGREL